MAANYSDVLGQLRAAGLLVSSLETGRMVRCKVDGDREKRGWYILHEMARNDGDVMLVGSFGVWRGDSNNAQKVELGKDALTSEQQAALRQRLADDKKRVERARAQQADRAARRAESVWRKLEQSGESDYLMRKGIGAYGVRFSPGAVVVPMLNGHGHVRGLQFILDRKKHAERIQKTGRDKEFWPGGLGKKGCFHLIGSPVAIVLVAEGYATGATLHAATGFPVAVAFDAGNLQPVCEVLHKRYPLAKILVCADDDALAACPHCQAKLRVELANCPGCGAAHGRINTGIERASLAALKVNGRYIAPRFSDEEARFAHFESNKGKLTDFNDVQAIEGLHAVRSQIETAIQQAGWRLDGRKGAGEQKQGGGDSDSVLRPIDTVDELLERFSLVYGMGGTVFDHKEHILMALSDMRDACLSRELHRRWHESPVRRIVRIEEVGFDPAGTDKSIKCNLWKGWPTVPKQGNCERLLELLLYMCNNDEALYRWVLCWLAYPLQHPGAKMKTCLVIHGPQGTGKNLFFEQIMAIYGFYGRVINQDAIEDKFNDWASRKLFLIADEVVARAELYHVKNKIKGFVTGDWIRINPKNRAAYDERNHSNVVFLSNERMPSVLEEDDRRHTVIWTPQKLLPDFYGEVAAEIAAGGTGALHYHLLNLDLGGFTEHSKPYHTVAKEELIELSRDSICRFHRAWSSGDIDGIKLMPALSEDVYELYRTWCGKQGVKPAPLNRMIDAMSKADGFRRERKRVLLGNSMSNPKTLVLPKAMEMPVGGSESAWLGDCVESFRMAVKDFKGRDYV